MKTIALEGAEYRFKEWNELSFSEFKRVLDLLWQISTAESDEDFGEPVGAFLNVMAPEITDLDKRTLAALFLNLGPFHSNFRKRSSRTRASAQHHQQPVATAGIE